MLTVLVTVLTASWALVVIVAGGGSLSSSLLLFGLLAYQLVRTFIYKFNGVKRELKKLKLIPDWLWCEIRDECIVLPIRGEHHAIVQDEDEMEAEPSRRTNASI